MHRRMPLFMVRPMSAPWATRARMQSTFPRSAARISACCPAPPAISAPCSTSASMHCVWLFAEAAASPSLMEAEAQGFAQMRCTSSVSPTPQAHGSTCMT